LLLFVVVVVVALSTLLLLLGSIGCLRLLFSPHALNYGGISFRS
jgi:hypothetical protein